METGCKYISYLELARETKRTPYTLQIVTSFLPPLQKKLLLKQNSFKANNLSSSTCQWTFY